VAAQQRACGRSRRRLTSEHFCCGAGFCLAIRTQRHIVSAVEAVLRECHTRRGEVHRAVSDEEDADPIGRHWAVRPRFRAASRARLAFRTQRPQRSGQALREESRDRARAGRHTAAVRTRGIDAPSKAIAGGRAGGHSAAQTAQRPCAGPGPTWRGGTEELGVRRPGARVGEALLANAASATKPREKQKGDSRGNSKKRIAREKREK
jgi:hypothetical protein